MKNLKYAFILMLLCQSVQGSTTQDEREEIEGRLASALKTYSVDKHKLAKRRVENLVDDFSLIEVKEVIAQDPQYGVLTQFLPNMLEPSNAELTITHGNRQDQLSLKISDIKHVRNFNQLFSHISDLGFTSIRNNSRFSGPEGVIDKRMALQDVIQELSEKGLPLEFIVFE